MTPNTLHDLLSTPVSIEDAITTASRMSLDEIIAIGRHADADALLLLDFEPAGAPLPTLVRLIVGRSIVMPGDTMMDFLLDDYFDGDATAMHNWLVVSTEQPITETVILGLRDETDERWRSFRGECRTLSERLEYDLDEFNHESLN